MHTYPSCHKGLKITDIYFNPFINVYEHLFTVCHVIKVL